MAIERSDFEITIVNCLLTDLWDATERDDTDTPWEVPDTAELREEPRLIADGQATVYKLGCKTCAAAVKVLSNGQFIDFGGSFKNCPSPRKNAIFHHPEPSS